jgi:hypothetical protein
LSTVGVQMGGFMKVIVTFAILLTAGAAAAQRVELNDTADQVVQEQLRVQQEQPLLEQQETEYDRQMCIKVGYRGPDIEQCVLDSAAYRMGISEAPLFVPDAPMRPMGLQCAKLDLGDGIRDTSCD